MENNDTLNANQISTLSVLYIVSLTPSLVGSFSVLMVSIVRWQRLQEQVLPLVQLSLADLLAASVLMFTSAMNETQISKHPADLCKLFLPLSLTFYFISFLLVVIYGWKSKNIIQGWRATQGHSDGQTLCQRIRMVLPVYTIVWLVPMAMYLCYVFATYPGPSSLIPAATSSPIPVSENAVIALNESAYCTSCILFLHIWRDPCPASERIHDIFILVFLFLAIIPALVSSSFLYYKVGVWYRDRQHVEGGGCSRRTVERVFSMARNMVLVIIFCWSPAILLIIMSTIANWTNIRQQSLFGLYIIQAVTLSLQGFQNSMVYAWRRPNFVDAVLGERSALMASYEQTAFFEESGSH